RPLPHHRRGRPRVDAGDQAAGRAGRGAREGSAAGGRGRGAEGVCRGVASRRKLIGEVVAQRVPGDKAHSFFLISCPRHEPAALAVEFSLILNDADSPALGVGRMAAQMEAVAVGQSNLPMIAHPLETLGAPELVIAMIGPLGVDLDLVASALAKALREVTYTSKVIRLSALLSTMSGFDAVLESSPEDR